MTKRGYFWIGLCVFQLVFGFTVYALTARAYKQEDVERTVRSNTARLPPAHPPVSGSIGDLDMQTALRYLENESITNNSATQTDKARFESISADADRAFEAGDYAKASTGYRRLLELAPQNADSYNNLALCEHYLGRHADAISVLLKGIALDPAYPRIHLTLGFVYLQTGDVENARKSLARAHTLAPQSSVGQEASRLLSTLGG